MNMPATFQAVIAHFQKNNWKFAVAEGRPILSASFRGKNGTFRLVAVVDQPDDLLQVFGFVPLIVPSHKQAAVAELCVRLSHNLKMGRFELDHSVGEPCFQTYSAYASGELKDEVIRRVVQVNLFVVDQHFPAFVAVIYTNTSPEEAARQVRARIASGQPTGPAPELEMAARLSLN